MRSFHLTAILCAAALLAAIPLSAETVDYGASLSRERPMVVDRDAKEIRLLARLQPDAFKPGWFTQLPGHHAVTWLGGRKADEALLATYTSDTDFYDAMISIGAKPGDNLTKEVWTERKNPRSAAPEKRVEGSPVDVFVWWKGLEGPIPLRRLLVDPAGKGIDLRFGGNKVFIPVWRSGCIVCMQSCPGAKISNRAYTFRDYVNDKGVFKVNENAIPKDIRDVVVIVRLRKDGESAANHKP